MKVTLVALLCCAALHGSLAAQLRQRTSPVSRVVQLLTNLAAQIEKEGKKEKDLYETFVCWGKSVMNQKTESNLAAETRSNELETYIADLDAGRIELTSERQDLEKEIEELTADLENAKAIREKENKDFESAKEEMEAAIKALDSAIKVLKEATEDHKTGTLLAVSADLNNGGMAAIAAESENLNKAVSLGEQFLSKADAMFLRRVLTGDVPEKDHKMLGKKATFKMSYKARSGKIQEVLAKLHQTFELNLQEAEFKEKKSADEYEKLSTTKGDLLDKAQTALSKMEVEGAARGLSKKEAEDEVAALKKQVEDDKKFIEETQKTLDEKEKEWDVRSQLRDDELAAISKAIQILHNDDARDLFKKSFASQGYLFLQLDSSSKQAITFFNRAASELKSAARRTGDRRMSALAALVAQSAADPKSVKTQFKPIIEAIDKMLKLLKEEETKDLETKESCEEDRMEDTRKALVAGRDIDEKSDKITKLEEEIKDLEEQIKALLEHKKKVQEELDKAEEIRKDENAAWVITDKDDKDAAAVVKDATEVLKNFYKDNFSLLFAQQPKVVAGEAPPPPPATWEEPYGGKKGESTGIISILEMVHEDIKKDRAKAKDEEDKAQTEFDQFKTESEKQMEDLQTQADKKEGIKGKKETERTDTITERETKFGEWQSIMKKMKDIAPDCEYYAVNYKIRSANRHIEIDGLNNAKAILEGASFK
jgi:hypothetical protein|mmetsp:Transcript_42148/g.67266  ORF Transcript_42148/g.67266 Transcript_42148/m.67266 type:complete len:711 (+) Transcript_42148:35-2167(+)